MEVQGISCDHADLWDALCEACYPICSSKGDGYGIPQPAGWTHGPYCGGNVLVRWITVYTVWQELC